jgi:hypothetical protein
MPKKVVRRRRSRQAGKGFGDFLGSALSGLGGGLGSGVNKLLSNLFGGKKRSRRSRKMRGRGAGEVLSKLNTLAKDTQIISKALDTFGGPQFLKTASAALGYGRKRGRRMRGGATMYHTQQVPILGMGNLRL